MNLILKNALLLALFSFYFITADSINSNEKLDVDSNLNNQNSYIEKNSFKVSTSQNLPEWIISSSVENAPELLKGIFSYLKAYPNCRRIPSFHRFLLVGEPGTGKTTLARVIAHILGYKVFYVAASEIMGSKRNLAAVRLRDFLHSMMKDQERKVIILDEINKLFEHFENDHYDDDATCMAFWLALDLIEKNYDHVIIIGTANNVNQLPAQILSRFQGKIITISLPNKQYRVRAILDVIQNDSSIKLHDSVDTKYLEKLIRNWHNCSLRDIQALIDTAKMYSFAEFGVSANHYVNLNIHHFERALNKLREESKENKQDFLTRISPKLKPYLEVTYLTLNTFALFKIFGSAVDTVKAYLNKISEAV